MDRDWMATYECDLLAYGTEALSQVADVQLMGTAKEQAAILAVVMDERIRMTSDHPGPGRDRHPDRAPLRHAAVQRLGVPRDGAGAPGVLQHS